jgi:hypothetical protein
MVDYLYNIPGSVGGQMMIRDSGGVVSYWITSGNSSSWDGELGWNGWINNTGVGGVFNYGLPGATWRQVGAWVVSTSQTVSFNKTTDSGSMGLGGTGGFSVSINRTPPATIPGQVTSLGISAIGHTTATASWARGGLNGGTFQHNQIQVSSAVQSGSGDFKGTVEITTTTTANSYAIKDLKLGQKYYVHVRTRNNVGYGPWSSIATFVTLAGAKVRVNGVWRDAVAYVRVNGVWKQAIPYVRVNGAWKDARN